MAAKLSRLNSDTTALSELYHLQFSLQAASYIHPRLSDHERSKSLVDLQYRNTTATSFQ
jgi:hypothetical protein